MNARAPLKTRRLDRALTLAGWLGVTIFVVQAAMLGDMGVAVRIFQVGWLVGFAGYALLLRIAWRLPADRVPGGWRLWLAGFVLMRPALLHTVPSDDLYRYMWEGEIQRHGFNPYVLAPAAEELRELREENQNGLAVNHPDYTAIYPPVAQLLFRAIACLGDSVYAAKFVFVALDIACVMVMSCVLRARRESPFRVAVYALCPLTLTAFAIEGHLDSLMLFWISVAAWLTCDRNWVACAVVIGLAIGSKLVCVVLLAWLARRAPRAAIVAVAVTAVTFIPFADAGGALFASLTRFGSTTGTLAFIVRPLEEWCGGRAARCGSALILVAFLVRTLYLRLDWCAFATRALAALVLVLPVVHFWYLTWFLSLAWARLRVAWLILAASMVFYMESARLRTETGVWQLPEWTYTAVYLPFAVAWCIESWWLRRRGAFRVTA